MILSIVIPVYNTEKYVHGTLSSIFSQASCSPQDFEVIIVNDGTKDQAMNIVSEFSSHSNLVVLEQENQGLSVARNTGMANAQGNYIWFVDSDDQIENNCLSKIISLLIRESTPDIFGFALNRINETDQSEKYCHPIYCKEEQHNCGRAINNRISYNLAGPTQRYIFKKTFLLEHYLTFYPGIYHEDIDFLFRAFYWCNHFYISQDSIYRYLIRSSGSITSSTKLKNMQDVDFIIRRMPKAIEHHNMDIKTRIQHYIYLYYNQISILTVLLKINPQASWKDQHKEIIKRNHLTYRRIALQGMIPALTIRKYKLAINAMAIFLSPWYFNRNLKTILN